MMINGIRGVDAGSLVQGNRLTQATDSYSKELQKQIDEAQKQLQELSSNEDLSAEEKMQKRQELQKKITDLTNLLRQHEIELRKEQQKESAKSMDEMLGAGKEPEAGQQAKKAGGLSAGSMEAMLSADAAKEQAQVYGSVSTGLKAIASTLRGEIQQDASRGSDVSAKQEELAKVEAKSEDAVSSQLGKLKEAGKTLDESAKEEVEKKRGQKDEKETQAAEQSYASVDILL